MQLSAFAGLGQENKVLKIRFTFYSKDMQSLESADQFFKFARITRGERASVAEFIRGYVETYSGQFNQLRELFVKTEYWEQRFPELFSLRLQGVSWLDEHLQSLVTMAINELSSHPSRALNQMRDIAA